jgi:hypothetical protein
LKRFNQAIKAYDGSGVAVPGLPLQVALFIRNLHDAKFRDFILDQNIIRASNWELDHPTFSRPHHDRSRTTTSTSYHTSVQSDTSFRGRGRRGGRGPRDQTNARGGRGRDQSSGANYTCDLCGIVGHYTNRCPKLSDAKNALLRSNGNSFHPDIVQQPLQSPTDELISNACAFNTNVIDLNRPSKDDV